MTLFLLKSCKKRLENVNKTLPWTSFCSKNLFPQTQGAAYTPVNTVRAQQVFLLLFEWSLSSTLFISENSETNGRLNQGTYVYFWGHGAGEFTVIFSI